MVGEVSEHFGKLSTLAVEPHPFTEVHATQENHNDTTMHVIPHEDAESPTKLNIFPSLFEEGGPIYRVGR